MRGKSNARACFRFFSPETCAMLHVCICDIHTTQNLGRWGRLGESRQTPWTWAFLRISISANSAPADPKSSSNLKRMTRLDAQCTNMMHLAGRIYRYGAECAGWLWGACACKRIFGGKLALNRPFGHLANLQIHSDWAMHRHRKHPCHMPYLARWDDLLGFGLWVPD